MNSESASFPSLTERLLQTLLAARTTSEPLSDEVMRLCVAEARCMNNEFRAQNKEFVNKEQREEARRVLDEARLAWQVLHDAQALRESCPMPEHPRPRAPRV